MGKKKQRGRPRLRPERAKTYAMQVRMEAAEREAFKAAADLAGIALSSWVRERLRTAARADLALAGRDADFLSKGFPMG